MTGRTKNPPRISSESSACGPAARSAPGFTLMETVIYLGLFSFVASMSIAVLYQMLGGQNQNRNRIEVDAEANFMMQKLQWGMTGAQTINQPALNATGTTLSVSKFNYAQNPIVFDVNSRNIRISKGGGAPAPLASGRVYVNQLLFEHVPAVQSAPEGVKITLTVVSSDIERPVPASTTVIDTIYLRR